MPNEDAPRLVVTVIANEVLSLLTSGNPYTERSEDGRSVLMRGPRVSQVWPGRTPAEDAAYRNGWAQISLTARQCMSVAGGEVVYTETHAGEPARVRLPTVAELLAHQKRAIGELGGGLEPMSGERAAELVAPVVVPENDRTRLLVIYGETDEPADGGVADEGESLMSEDKPRREIVINGTLRTEGPLELVLADGRKVTVHASGDLTVRHPDSRLAEYDLELPTVEHVAERCQALGNDRGGMGSGEVPVTAYHRH